MQEKNLNLPHKERYKDELYTVKAKTLTVSENKTMKRHNRQKRMT